MSEEDLSKAFEKVRGEIREDLHPIIDEFISSPSGWSQEAAALAECEWEDIRPLFEGLRRVTLNLGDATIKFYDDGHPDLLSDEDGEYLELLSKRPKGTQPLEEDQAAISLGQVYLRAPSRM